METHLAVFIFGFTGILGRLIDLDSPVLVWHRLWMASLLMFVYLSIIGKFRFISGRESIKFLLFSSTITIHWILFYGTIKYAGVSVAMICLSSATFFTAVLEPISLRKPVDKIQLLFSLLVMVGIWLIADAQQGGIGGIIMGLVSAFFSALFTVLNKTIVNHYDSRLHTFYSLFGGFVLLSLFLPIFHEWKPDAVLMPSSSDWLYLFLLSFVCTFIAFNLFIRSLRYLSSFTANLSNNLEPVYGILLAFIFFKEYEMLGVGFYLGALLIISSVMGEVFYQYYRFRKNKNRDKIYPGSIT